MAEKSETFFSLEECLERSISKDELKEVKRILFGKQLA